MGCGDLIGYHVGGIYNRWEYAVTGDPIEQIGSAEPEAEAGQLVLSGACMPWLKRGMIQKMPKSLGKMMLSAFEEEQQQQEQQEKEEKEEKEAEEKEQKVRSKSKKQSNKRLKNLKSLKSSTSRRDSGESRKSRSGTDEFKDFPFHGVVNDVSGNFLLTSIDIGMTSLTLTKEMKSRHELSTNQPETFRDILSCALPVLRNYIPRPVLIALDAGQSVWSAQFFRVVSVCTFNP